VNRTFSPIIIAVLLVAGGILWIKPHRLAARAAEPAPAKSAEAPEGPKLSRDADGNVVIGISEKARDDMGIKAEKPAATQLAPEIKSFGRVVDPGPMSAIRTELEMAQAAYTASSNELARLQVLQAQGNGSARALQAAEAAATHDRLAIQAVRDRAAASWGPVLAELPDLPGLIRSLTSGEAILVRIDLSAGEPVPSRPENARIVTLNGETAKAHFCADAPTVDPRWQGHPFLFLIKPATFKVVPGEAVTAFLELPGEPLKGVVVPREAVVRAEGEAWIYIPLPSKDGVKRVPVSLDHAVNAGYFVTKGVTVENEVVVVGAQQLLSTELKAQGANE
jgi:hypothetical protein